MSCFRFIVVRRVIAFLILLASLIAVSSAHAAASLLPLNANTNSIATARADANTNASEFHALSYHDVFANPENAATADSLSVSVDDLVRQFSWLRDNNYRVVSMSDVIAARSGGAALPPKAVLLTFDDGYASFHTHVLPLLKLFKYPATLAVVAGWIEAPISTTIEYESDRIDPAKFMTWSQVRDCVDSGLVEIASHTFNLHHGEIGNPQGNKQPAASTRIFDTKTQKYESDDEYKQRIRTDLQRSSEIIQARSGRRPRVVVWPYGAYTSSASEIASELGMQVGLTLDAGINNNATPLNRLGRVLIAKRDTLIDLAGGLQPVQRRSERVLTVNSQSLFSADAQTFESNLSKLMDRIVAIKPRSVILSSYETSQTDTDSRAPKMWFSNSAATANTDLLNRAAWQIRTRTGVRVFVDLPEIRDAGTSASILQAMGKRVPLTGVVFPASVTQDHATTSRSLAAFKDSQVRAESMHRLRLSALCEASAQSVESVLEWRAALSSHDWVLLRADTCSRAQWQRLASLANRIPEAMHRTIIEHAVSIESAGSELEQAVISLEFANAAGFRHLGISEMPGAVGSRAEKSSIEMLRRAISIETYPVRR
jgi:peptidoglycan/xylan/chitin deacetylase (PgdA/CDA1 family)